MVDALNGSVPRGSRLFYELTGFVSSRPTRRAKLSTTLKSLAGALCTRRIQISSPASVAGHRSTVPARKDRVWCHSPASPATPSALSRNGFDAGESELSGLLACSCCRLGCLRYDVELVEVLLGSKAPCVAQFAVCGVREH